MYDKIFKQVCHFILRHIFLVYSPIFHPQYITSNNITLEDLYMYSLNNPLPYSSLYFSLLYPSNLSYLYNKFNFNFFQVKKIMNSVYQQLRSNFEADTNYQGDEVLAAILGVIKVVYNSTILSQYLVSLTILAYVLCLNSMYYLLSVID